MRRVQQRLSGSTAARAAAASSPTTTFFAPVSALALVTLPRVYRAALIRSSGSARAFSVASADGAGQSHTDRYGRGLAATSSGSALHQTNDDTSTTSTYRRVEHGPAERPTQAHELARPIMIAKVGADLINDSVLNKGVAFSQTERDRFELRGLIPAITGDLQSQAARIERRLEEPETLISPEVAKAQMLYGLYDRNETLFYRVLTDNIKELAPIIYTPTVGEVCKRYGQLYRKPRGMYFSPEDRGEIATAVYNWRASEVDAIVITDGSRILGLGDLGANGMPIPIGKLCLYTAAGGIDPARTLPIMFDAGTNNKELLSDPLYMGHRAPRISGEDYYSLFDELMWSLRNRWPHALIQFEDFSNTNAYPLLHKYRHEYLCFNDDIQGTGAVVLAGIFSALKAKGKTVQDITKERIVCLGSGSAGLGVCFSLLQGMCSQGMTPDQAFKNFWMVDFYEGKQELVTTQRAYLSQGQKEFARADLEPVDFFEVIKRVKPTILLGLSGVGGQFSESIIREMSKHVDRPIIFPLSNPSKCAEATAEQAFHWSDGRAIVATGSPFDPVRMPNGEMRYPSQGNNMFVFPGVGLGAIACGASRISVSMFARASEALSECVPQSNLDKGIVYPDVDDIRQVSTHVAVEVARVAYDKGLARIPLPEGISLERFIERQMWEPMYHPYVRWDVFDEMSKAQVASTPRKN